MSVPEYLTILVSLAIIIGLVSYIFYLRNQNYIEFCKRHKKELEEDYEDTVRKLNEAKKEFGVTSQEYEQSLRRLQEVANEIKQKETFNQTLYQIREEELNNLIENKRQVELEKLNKEIEEWESSAQDAASFNSEQIQEFLQEEINQKEKELKDITSTINDYKARRDVINQEILRARAIEEQQDFYRIQLDDKSKEDIAFLLSITDRFNNKEIIYKLIWSEYIQKPFKNMVNRVLGNKDPKNVIYMIKNMDTNEIYIGKTKAEVSKRWTEHVKTSLNIGTISRTNIHKALFNNWDKFAFTVLEEVPAAMNLGDREKYYIKFYESDVFGYNIKSGG